MSYSDGAAKEIEELRAAREALLAGETLSSHACLILIDENERLRRALEEANPDLLEAEARYEIHAERVTQLEADLLLAEARYEIRADLRVTRLEAENARLREQRDLADTRLIERGKELARVKSEKEKLRTFVERIRLAHEAHLQTGDYTHFGIAAQDAFLELEKNL